MHFLIIEPFCEPKIIPLVVDTGTSHTTLNPKGVCDLGITSTVMGMLSTGAIQLRAQASMLYYMIARVIYEYGGETSRDCEGYPCFKTSTYTG